MSLDTAFAALSRSPRSDRQITRPEVNGSPDLTRILAIPRRPLPTKEQLEVTVETMTALLRRENTACECAELNPKAVAQGRTPCITRLLPVQAWYLWEAMLGRSLSEMLGVFGLIGIGHGKTGIDILLPMVLEGCKTALLLVPPALQKQLQMDYRLWAQHFRVPNLTGGLPPYYPDRPVLEVLPYSQLSRPENTAYLAARNPDTIIGDEAHSLRNPEAAGTSRFLRYLKENQNRVRVYLHTGSASTRGIADFYHLLAAVLRALSPLPLDPMTVKEWAGAIDPVPEDREHLRAPPGALRRLCKGEEDPRSGFQRRLVETFGVVSTREASLKSRLVIGERTPPKVPQEVRDAIRLVKESAARPDGETLLDILDIMTTCRQIACGFYYRWRFPHVYDAEGREVEDDEGRAKIVDEWFDARTAWGRELRDRLAYRAEHMDSPKLLRAAAERHYSGYRGDLPTWASKAWPWWSRMRDRVEHVPDTVWISDYLVQDAANWARSNVGVIWYVHGSFGRALAKATGMPRYGSDTGKVENLNATAAMLKARDAMIRQGYKWHDKPSDWIQTEDGSRTVICSQKAHGTGKNLQAWHRMLFANLMADGGAWEQTLGRLHRNGQPKDMVHAELYQHTAEMVDALSKARGYASYIQETQGNSQRLMYADWLFSPP